MMRGGEEEFAASFSQGRWKLRDWRKRKNEGFRYVGNENFPIWENITRLIARTYQR